jgi:hypothetical protein
LGSENDHNAAKKGQATEKMDMFLNLAEASSGQEDEVDASERVLMSAKKQQSLGQRFVEVHGQQDLVFSVLAIAFYIVAGLAYYGGQLGWTIVEVVYFAVATLTTVGYGRNALVY